MIVMETIMILNNVNFDFLKLLGILGTIMLVVITPILIYRIYRPKIVISKKCTITKKGYLRFKIQNLCKYKEVFDVTIYVTYVSKNITNRYNIQPVCIPCLYVKSSTQKDKVYNYERIITIQQPPKSSENNEYSVYDFFKNNVSTKELSPCVEITIIVYDKYTSIKHSYSRLYYYDSVVENGVFYDSELEPREIPSNQD